MSRQFADHVCDMLSPLGEVTASAMFGGFGIYLDGLMFALIAWDTLYLKADDRNSAMFEEAGSAPFKPWEDKPMVMPYWEVPADVMEEAAQLCAWSRAAFDAALRTRKPKKPKRPSLSSGKRTR